MMLAEKTRKKFPSWAKKASIAFLLLLLLLIFAFFSGAIERDLAPSEIPKCPDCNIVLIMADCFSPARAGFGESERNTTPNLDKLAEKSVVFERAFSPAANTFDSSVSIFSEKRVSEHDSFVVFGFERETKSPLETLPERLDARGYYTFFSANGIFPSTLVEGGERKTRGADREDIFPYLDKKQDALTAQAEKFVLGLESLKNAREPFFAFFETGILHRPYGIAYVERRFGNLSYSGPFLDISEKTGLEISDYRAYVEEDNQTVFLNNQDVDHLASRYDDKLFHLDEQLGKVLSYIEDSGLSNRTIVIVTSYHGEALGEDGNFGHDYYFQSFHTPLVVSSPGLNAERVTYPVELVDLGRTIDFLTGKKGASEMTFFSEKKVALMEIPLVSYSDLPREMVFFSEKNSSVRHSLNYSFLPAATDGEIFVYSAKDSLADDPFFSTSRIDWKNHSASEEISSKEAGDLFFAIKDGLPGSYGERKGTFKPFLPRLLLEISG